MAGSSTCVARFLHEESAIMIEATQELAHRLRLVGCALAGAGDQLARDGNITRAEQEIHAMTQCLSLLETAAVCLEAGNPEHANRILDYVSKHKERAISLAETASRPWKAAATQAVVHHESKLAAT